MRKTPKRRTMAPPRPVASLAEHRQDRVDFQTAVRRVALRHVTVTIDHVYGELHKINAQRFSLKKTARLAAEAGLCVDWDGVMPRSAAFEEFIR